MKTQNPKPESGFPAALMRRLLLLLSLMSLLTTAVWAESDWIAESNQHAQLVLELLAKYNPEGASALGVEGYDEEIMDLNPDLYNRLQMDVLASAKLLKERLGLAKDPNVKQDLGILIKRLEDEYQTNKLEHELLLPYHNLSREIYQGFQRLLDPRVDNARYPAAIERLKKYNGTAEGYAPITKLAMERTSEAFTRPDLIGPYENELSQDRENSDSFMAGIKKLFVTAGLDGWQEDFQLLEEQLLGYERWLVKELHPRARKSHLLPEALYANSLKNFGVEMAPRELIRRAQFGFAEIRAEMEALASRLALEKGYSFSDYREVIKALKKEQTSSEEIIDLYKKRLAEIEEIIRKQQIITLPKRDVVIRLATEAESSRIPAPHLSTPQLIGNTGQPNDFVMPLNNPNSGSKEKMDDFTHQAAAWTLTAHEARPGHELQYSSMIEKGVSITRGIFAFNSANVEGWALYAEAVMKEYFPADGQMVALQHRMLRAARAFLDPMLNMGMLDREEVKTFLMEEVVLSEPMAQQEIDRYSFRAPGQATSYYFGYIQLMTLRTEVELALKDEFRQKAYHDFILQQGLLPLDQLRDVVLQQFAAVSE